MTELDSRRPDSAPDAYWYDPVAVDRALRGRRVGRKLTRAELRGVVRHMDDYGASSNDLIPRLGISATTFSQFCKDVADEDGHSSSATLNSVQPLSTGSVTHDEGTQEQHH